MPGSSNALGRKKSPNTCPPYFWHRYTVWYGLIYFLLYWGSLRLLDIIVPVDEATSTLRSFALSFARMALVWGMPLYLRKRWAVKELTRLEQKITATLERGSSRSIEIPEATKKLSYFRDDLQAYLRPSSLSIRRTPWPGAVTRYTLYRRGKPKRVVTFSMSRYHFEIEKRAGAFECFSAPCLGWPLSRGVYDDPLIQRTYSDLFSNNLESYRSDNPERGRGEGE